MNPMRGENGKLLLNLVDVLLDAVEDLDGHVLPALVVERLVDLAKGAFADEAFNREPGLRIVVQKVKVYLFSNHFTAFSYFQ